MRDINEIASWINLQLPVSTEQPMSPENAAINRTDSINDNNRNTTLATLYKVLTNYKQYELKGLSGDIDLAVLENLSAFCASEKERYQKQTYEMIKSNEPLEKAFPDSEAMRYFQEAEIYVLMLITVRRKNQIKCL